MRARDRSRTIGLALTSLLLVLALAFTVESVQTTAGTAVSAFTEYVASRIRRGLPWVLDPRQLHLDDGPLPIVSLQTYSGVFDALIALLPAAHARVWGGVLMALVWFGVTAWMVSRAPRARRATVAIVGLSFLCLEPLLRVAAGLQADALAAACAALGLASVLSRRVVTWRAQAWLLAAALLKPNVIGVLGGIVLADLWIDRRRALVRWTPFALLGAAGLALLQAHTHGVWLLALRATTQNAFELSRWTFYLWSYAALLGAPQAAWAVWVLRRHPRDPRARYGALAVLASVAWQALAMGRHGSSTHYWLEPVLATTTLLALGPVTALPRRWCELVHVATPIVIAAFSYVPTRDVLRDFRTVQRDRDATMALVAQHCQNDAEHSWISTVSQLELEGTGKIAAFEFGLQFAQERGEWSSEVLRELLAHPACSCFVHYRDLAEPIPAGKNPRELTLYDRDLAAFLLEHYEDVASAYGHHVYRRRTP